MGIEVYQAYLFPKLSEYAFHSSELMPGGSPAFQSVNSVEKLHEDLDALFHEASKYYIGATLCEFYEKIGSECNDTYS